MTAPPAQLAANCANAARSTGPRSDDGKATAARNALDHGVYAADQTLAALKDQPSWAVALRRYDGSDAAYPRAALLYRADTAADRRFQATLRQLLALQAARRGPAPDPLL